MIYHLSFIMMPSNSVLLTRAIVCKWTQTRAPEDHNPSLCWIQSQMKVKVNTDMVQTVWIHSAPSSFQVKSAWRGHESITEEPQIYWVMLSWLLVFAAYLQKCYPRLITVCVHETSRYSPQHMWVSGYLYHCLGSCSVLGRCRMSIHSSETFCS